ncbi:hypothetical protein DXT99_10595 [Pontibacter diazotrophicus]|uniref:Uncharacterized protein n=1 Tax=Pontibacter diazotrophicus TaxID=1400979 RepID=A0A3D8LCN2_9BACT|nr:hypothetical protein DXT99_10595 [Pontibacter diazotrophicus]
MAVAGHEWVIIKMIFYVFYESKHNNDRDSGSRCFLENGIKLKVNDLKRLWCLKKNISFALRIAHARQLASISAQFKLTCFFSDRLTLAYHR